MDTIGIFGDFTKQEKKKQPTLFDMAVERFKDPYLLAMIEKYIQMRRERHDLPARTSFEAQLKLLEEYEPQDRFKQVELSILGGYRSLCYPRKTKVVKIEDYVKKKKEKEKINYTRGF